MKRGTPSRATSPTNAESEPDDGCAFVLEEENRATAGQLTCAAPRRAALALPIATRIMRCAICPPKASPNVAN